MDESITCEYAKFMEMVYQNPGCKIHDIWSGDGEIPLWKLPESLGLIECVGSYKWKPSEKLEKRIHAAFKTAINNAVIVEESSQQISDKGIESLSKDESIVENAIDINKKFHIEDLGFGGSKRGPDWLISKNLKTEE